MNEDLYCCKYCRFMRKGECHKNPPSPSWPNVLDTDWCGSFDFSKEADRIMDGRRVPVLDQGKIDELVRQYKERL